MLRAIAWFLWVYIHLKNFHSKTYHIAMIIAVSSFTIIYYTKDVILHRVHNILVNIITCFIVTYKYALGGYLIYWVLEW